MSKAPEKPWSVPDTTSWLTFWAPDWIWTSCSNSQKDLGLDKSWTRSSGLPKSARMILSMWSYDWRPKEVEGARGAASENFFGRWSESPPAPFQKVFWRVEYQASISCSTSSTCEGLESAPNWSWSGPGSPVDKPCGGRKVGKTGEVRKTGGANP